MEFIPPIHPSPSPPPKPPHTKNRATNKTTDVPWILMIEPGWRCRRRPPIQSINTKSISSPHQAHTKVRSGSHLSIHPPISKFRLLKKGRSRLDWIGWDGNF